MIAKFLKKFEEFSSNEIIKDLSDEAKVNLFGLYVQIMSSNDTNETKPPKKGVKTATNKQIGFIKSLIRKGKIQDVDTDNLSIKEASDLIAEAVKKPESTPTVIEEVNIEDDSEDKTFTGSYLASSNGQSSAAHFWE